MKFNALNIWHDWLYLPTIRDLTFFNVETGEREGMWYIDWEFDNLVFRQNLNILPAAIQDELQIVIQEWERSVTEKYRSHG
jgi:hypothetical protein